MDADQDRVSLEDGALEAREAFGPARGVLREALLLPLVAQLAQGREEIPGIGAGKGRAGGRGHRLQLPGLLVLAVVAEDHRGAGGEAEVRFLPLMFHRQEGSLRCPDGLAVSAASDEQKEKQASNHRALR